MVDACSMWSCVAHSVGCVVLARLMLECVNFVHTCFLRPGKDLKQYGEWALVTGATDGIGKAIAAELAKQKLKVLLVSRTQSRLDETAKELPGEGHETLALDFSGEFTQAKKDKLSSAIKGKSLGVVVNNVGISYEHAEFFAELEPERVDQLIKLNIDSTTWVTYLCLPQMVAAKKGAIVNISSGLAVLSCPLYAQYSAAKEYIVRLTQSLNGEYKGKGIDFQVQLPAFVTSKLSKIRKPSATTPSPEVYAKAAVKAIGYDTEISPFWAHYIICGIGKWLPTPLADKVCMSSHMSIRKRALKKKAEKTE